MVVFHEAFLERLCWPSFAKEDWPTYDVPKISGTVKT